MLAVFLNYTVTACKVKFGPFGWAWNWLSVFFLYDLCCDYILAAPLEEDVEVLSAYLIQLVGTQNLEQLWKVLKFLDRYATNFCCCFNCKIGHFVLIRYKVYRHAGIQGTQVYWHTGHKGRGRLLWDIQQWLGIKWEKGECRGKYRLNPPIDCKTARIFA